MNHQGFGNVRDGWRLGTVGVVVYCRADEQQQIRFALLGGEGGDIAAEGETCQCEQFGFGVLRAGVVDDGDAVLRFTASVIVCAFAVAYAAQVWQVAVETELR